jgi:hypothetical protein
MYFAFLALLCCAVVTALTGEDALEKWDGPRGGGKISHGGNNIGTGNKTGIPRGHWSSTRYRRGPGPAIDR